MTEALNSSPTATVTVKKKIIIIIIIHFKVQLITE
jgi:hypothetical protein